MTELELQGEYVMDFFCRRNDGLGYREVKNNAVTPDPLYTRRPSGVSEIKLL